MTTASPTFGLAFVGVSLDSKAFTRDWVSFALRHILARHEQLMFVLADDLSRYTRTTRSSADKLRLDFDAASAFTKKRGDEVRSFLQSEVDRLGDSQKKRVELKSWSDFSDANYAGLTRNFRIAYDTIEAFRACVLAVAQNHFDRLPVTVRHHSTAESCASYILDEIGMCLRITEIGGWSNEYHPSSDIETLTELYGGKFADFGLTIERLIGKQPKRIFQFLAALP